MKFNTLFVLGGVALLGCFILSCSSKSKTSHTTNNDNLKVLQKTETVNKESVRMPLSDVTSHIQFQGKEGEIRIFRTPDDSLPVVLNDQGDTYIDNRITIRITCQEHLIVNHSFTKNSFSSLIDEHFLQNSILEGIVYDTISSNQILFAASVSYPESDLYVPIRLLINADGNISIEKIDLLNE